MLSKRRSTRGSRSLISITRLDSSSIEEKEKENDETSACKLEVPASADMKISTHSDQATSLIQAQQQQEHQQQRTNDNLEQASEEQKECDRMHKMEENDDDMVRHTALNGDDDGDGDGDGDSEENDDGDGDDDFCDGAENDEDPDGDSANLSFCRGISKTPLAVPMVAEMTQQSVTRNDAKVITHSRLRRLKELSKRPETALSKDQKDEKKRIIRLEKNRRAAAMSRRKKKMYVKNLEEKTQLMARHLAIIEMENAHLRAMLNATQQANAAAVAAAGHGMHGPPAPQQLPPATHSINSMPRIGNVGAYSYAHNSKSVNSSSSNVNGNSATHTHNTSKAPSSSPPRAGSEVREPPLKRRRLSLTSASEHRQCKDECGESVSVLEPLPVQDHVKYMPYNTAPHLMSCPQQPPHSTLSGAVLNLPPLPPHLLHDGRSMATTHASSATHAIVLDREDDETDDDEQRMMNADDDIDDDDEVQLIQHIHGTGNNTHHNMNMNMSMDMNMNMRQVPLKRDPRSTTNDDGIPPEVVVPRLSNEFISILDAEESDLMNESMDDIAFPNDNNDKIIYL
uniref:BZIP domain-containing protein n=1 Tax=Elphidium margaritaceum TaxID=933848 RepID=A0A7S0TEA9_9EUKA|mmetsp:Transcript_1686/g.3328  ORF Transcript_1686/g.3328 Transcript_1686/m.3328 type:complete len:568 (+) Transcript_1686:111-1814(+)